ncbi:ribonuclease HII [Arcobacter sp. CECT 8986]|uniref:ribonuclease HII n=1 Tax=Arcobacter sp. CECT 8986 TaxID=2044507 RepID=UPI001009883D|nr:ribonuclease HII [Arcobacter sp. CECT 8986]RXJ99456.1 ribonuclease HII [Arcobacter sp. CECT 8986]
MLCGIDEAGRGPLAGPLVVAGAILNEQIEELNDSKKLSEKKREELFKKITKSSTYHIVFKSCQDIDTKGISQCLKESILEIMQTLNADEFLMDGNTSFGIDTLQHKIKADATVKEVSAASILAKVSRDRYMCEISKDYPQYNFEKHKGYGTKAHVEKIKEFGRSKEHRFSFRLKELGEEKGGVQKSLF